MQNVFQAVGGLSAPRRTNKVEAKDWSNIDWVYDKELTNRKRAKLHQRTEGGDLRATAAVAWEGSQALLAVILTGISCGVLASFVDVTHRWMSDLKTGVCGDYFWLPRKECCMQESSVDETSCTAWLSWSEAIFGKVDAAEESGGALGFFAYAFLAMAMAGTSSWLMKTFAGYAAGSGIVELKLVLAGSYIKRFLSGWTLVLKVLGLALSVGSGMRVGKEGPFIHITSCVGHVVSRLFPTFQQSETKYRELISASAAAGISVAFGAPIGGVLFSLEEVSYFFGHKTMYQALICCIVAAMTLQRIDPTHTGKLSMFQVDYRHTWHWFELSGFVLLGVLGGVIGSAVTYFNIKWYKVRKYTELKNWPVTEVVVSMFITSAFNYNLPYMTGGALDFLANSFRECKRSDTENVCARDEFHTLVQCLVTALCAIILTCFTFGSKVPCGIFVPTMYIGGLVGRAVGIWMKGVQATFPGSYLFSECQTGTACVVPGIYAIVGSLAVLAGTTRMTVCLVVIAFEMTGGLEYLVPVSVAVMTAKWVGEWMGIMAIYEEQIKMNHFPFLDPKREFDFDSYVRDMGVTNRKIVTIPTRGQTIDQLNSLLDTVAFHGFPIVASETDRTLIGYITRRNLMTALQDTSIITGTAVTPNTFIRFDEMENDESAMLLPANSRITATDVELDFSLYVDHSPILVNPTTSIARVMYLFKSLGVRNCLVVRSSQLVSIITKKDLLGFMNKVTEQGFVTPLQVGHANNMDRTLNYRDLEDDPSLDRDIQVRVIRAPAPH
jgi:chloride channel 3/4/5